jgi:hypothetical protein
MLNYASAERALSEAVRCVQEVLDCDDVPAQGAETTCEGAVPWTTVQRIMEDIGVDETHAPPGEQTELWTVVFRDVGDQRYVHVTLAFGGDGVLCAAGMYAD